MAKLKLLLSLVLFSSVFGYAATSDEITLNTKNQEPLVCTRVRSGDLQAQEEIFTQAFSVAYRNISLETLGIKSLPDFLKSAFEDEKIDLNDPQKQVYIFDAHLNNKFVGFISFEPTSTPGEVYIRQLAVDPNCKKQGIGRSLVSLCKNQLPATKTLIVATRRVNQEARGFYTALGFTEIKEVPHGLNAERYIGFEYTIAQ